MKESVGPAGNAECPRYHAAALIVRRTRYLRCAKFGAFPDHHVGKRTPDIDGKAAAHDFLRWWASAKSPGVRGEAGYPATADERAGGPIG